MAQVMLCEGGHIEGVAGQVLLQYIGSPDSNVFCAACFEVFLWSAVEALPTFDARVMGYMDTMIEKQKSNEGRAAKRAAKRAETSAEPKDSAPDQAAAESTVTEE